MSEPKITKDNLECTDLWKKMREGHPDKYYMEFYYKWLVRVKNFNAEAILDVIYNGHKYKEKYYFEWLREYLAEYYELDKIVRS